MISTASLLGLILLSGASQGGARKADRYDLGVRLKRVELAWVQNEDPAKRRAAVPLITQSVTAFFSGSYGTACQALDKATGALTGRSPSAEDAVTARRMGDQVVLDFAYEPAGFPARIGKYNLEAMGQQRFLSLAEAKENLAQFAPLLDLETPKDLDARQQRLRESGSGTGKAIASLIDGALAGKSESDVRLNELLEFAENSLKDPKYRPSSGEYPLVVSGRSRIRAWLPKSLRADTPVVIALHGAGGSENLFFEGYGGGMAVRLAKDRNWAFLSPSSSPTACKDSLDWVTEQMGSSPKTVFVIGHSMGGGLALSTAGSVGPKAVAVFAPAGRSRGAGLESTPLWVGVGKQEIMMLAGNARALKSSVQEYREYDPCEHLMIVACGLPDAYKFLDSHLNRQ
jgi:hypothetical protein